LPEMGGCEILAGFPLSEFTNRDVALISRSVCPLVRSTFASVIEAVFEQPRPGARIGSKACSPGILRSAKRFLLLLCPTE
jgi:hypothetical protein